MKDIEYESGVRMPISDWLELNEKLVFDQPNLMRYVAPFPPPDLMQVVSGLTSESSFALHGTTIYRAMQGASPKPLTDFRSILDFGCGCGRLARMFKGHPGKIAGCDIDKRLVDWINGNLPYVRATKTQPNRPLPFERGEFDAVISVSVFTHLNEESQHLYLSELARVTDNGAYLFLTVHGKRALARALEEERIFQMLEISIEGLDAAVAGMDRGFHNFILQETGHLTTSEYQYGITFIPSAYVKRVWGEYFEITDIVNGAIHDFQDIIVCRKR